MANKTRALGYILENEDKVRRALDGAMNSKGEFVGGVRKPDGTYDEGELLAEYDRIGGLVLKGEDKVRMGSFYDFRARKARADAVVEFEYRVNGELIIVPAEVEKPVKVKAAQIAEKAKKEKAVVKKAKK
jgi:hypothetical protein